MSDAADGDQTPLHDRPLDVFDELLVMLGLVIAGLTERLRQPVLLHYFNPHGALLIVCFGNSPAHVLARRCG